MATAPQRARGRRPRVARKVILVGGGVLLLIGGCFGAVGALENLLSFGGEGQPINFEFMARPAPGPAMPDLPAGDVILASETSYDPRVTDRGTFAIPIDGRTAGQPVKLLDANARSLSPGSHYVVTYSPDSKRQQIIRLRDRQVVGEIAAHGFIFVDDHRIVAFGSDDRYRFGGAEEIDLQRRTVRPLDVKGVETSATPTFVANGEIGLCMEEELDAGSGPTCASTRILNISTGDTRPLPNDPAPSISATGELLFTKKQPWASRKVGAEVIYWLDDDEATDGQGRSEPLRAGRPTGPDADDREGSRPVRSVQTISSTTNGQWIVVDQHPTGGGPGIAACDIATLTCSDLTFQTPQWSLVGVVSTNALDGA